MHKQQKHLAALVLTVAFAVGYAALPAAAVKPASAPNGTLTDLRQSSTVECGAIGGTDCESEWAQAMPQPLDAAELAAMVEPVSKHHEHHTEFRHTRGVARVMAVVLLLYLLPIVLMIFALLWALRWKDFSNPAKEDPPSDITPGANPPYAPMALYYAPQTLDHPEQKQTRLKPITATAPDLSPTVVSMAATVLGVLAVLFCGGSAIVSVGLAGTMGAAAVLLGAIQSDKRRKENENLNIATQRFALAGILCGTIALAGMLLTLILSAGSAF